MIKTPLVWIIILNCNGLKDTIECLDSIKLISYPNYQVCVVDNGSPANEISAIAQRYPDVHIIKNSTNMGFSAACNQGATYGMQLGAEYLLFLNNDTIVDRGFLDKLVDSYATDQNLGIVGSKIYYYTNKNVIWSCGGLFSYTDGPFVNIGQCELDRGQYSPFTYTDYVTACCALVKVDVFSKVGGFNEDYFAYVEDVELCVRISVQYLIT